MDRPWSPLQIRLHWLVALLLLLQWGSGYFMPAVFAALEQHSTLTAGQFLVSTLHSYGGLAILALVALRIHLRLRAPAAQSTQVLPPLLRWLARLVQAGLYAALIALALSGMLVYYEVLPAAGSWHKNSGRLLLLLISLHVLAVLYHRWSRRDGVLAGMWPDSWPRL